jgi:asparagine synthase (glutamine-hydrolysing)
MPGIVGMIKKGSVEQNKRDLDRMVKTMMHEPFYKSGTYSNHKLGVHIGWVCHEGSFSDCMPVLNEKKDVVLIFTGEDFLSEDVKRELQRKGHEFDLSDASYLVHLYEDEGDKFLLGLNGSFSGVIVDLRKFEILLFNDRFGMQRLYFAEIGETFMFSSEAKALLEVMPQLREINHASLGEFLSYGCVLDSRSLFSNVHIMPGGSAWRFQDGQDVAKNQYFRITDWEHQDLLDTETYYQRLKEIFPTVVRRYFYPRTSIGMSLTGGLDTRLILAYADLKDRELPCYTFAGKYRESFDVLVARKVSAICNQSHQVLRLDDEFLSNFSRYAEKAVYVTDGNVEVCGAHEIYLNGLARRIAPIRMTGNCGSEVLRNVHTLKANPPCSELLSAEYLNYVKESERTLAKIKTNCELSFSLFNEIPRSLYGTIAAAQSQVSVRSPFMDNELVALVYKAPGHVRSSNEIILRLIADARPDLGIVRTDRGVGPKSRNPFGLLVRLWHESLFKSEYYYNHGMPHWLAKVNHTLKMSEIERLFLGRHKFEHYRIWFRNELSSYIQDIILDSRTMNRECFNKRFLEKMVSHHTRGDRNYTNEISKTITVELVHRLFLENYS